MPTLQCPNCGKVVRFEGVAGVCPGCASVVRAKAVPSSTPTPAKAPEKPRGRTQAADLDALDSGAEEVFDPGSSHARHHHNPFAAIAHLDKRLLYAIGAALFLLFAFGVYVVVRPASSSVSLAPTPTFPRPVAPDAGSSDTTPTPPPPPPVIQVIQNPQPTTSATTRQAVSRPAWMAAVPVAPKLPALPISDPLVGETIKKSVGFLKSQLTDSKLTNPAPGGEMYEGASALTTYALLQAGLAVDDADLSASSPFMQGLLDQLKAFPMDAKFVTYGRSLRMSALALLNREADQTILMNDRKYLLASELLGKYTYSMYAPNTDPERCAWDHSNGQYGVLGIWASVQAGIAAPDKYWNDIEQHWLATQDNDGGWTYTGTGGRDTSELPMTTAGVTTLCVTAEQLELINSKGKKDAHPALTRGIEAGLKYLGSGDNLVKIGPHPGYTLYGIERAALATGYRWFGDHDWYSELGAGIIAKQRPDGSFDGDDQPVPETDFRVLFLSRGRQPVFMSKLRFEGAWNDRPRDVAKLTQFASAQLEKPFAWGVADLSRHWWDWLESPLLMISTDSVPNFTDEDCTKFRAYTDAGGLIFFHNEFASKEMDAYVTELTSRIYPEYPLTPVGPDDLLYSCDFPIKSKPPLKSVTNGTRTLFVYSPKDLTQDWVRYRAKDSRANANLQMGINLFVTAAGKSDFRNRLNTPYEPPSQVTAVCTVPVLQVHYPGSWNPEPKAYERFSRWFQNQTSLELDFQPTSMMDITPQCAPLAVLTGNKAVDFSKMDCQHLHDFVIKGGVLFIDSTGGSKEFANSVRTSLLPTAFPGVAPTGIPLSDPILSGKLLCTDKLPKAHLRNYASMILDGTPPSVEYAPEGQGAIIISDIDVTTGLLDSGTYAILGYTPAYCQSLAKNIVLWSLNRYASSK